MNDSNRVRVRFAPSPTGYLHIGGARTVLFNWLLARKHGGTFILRIEDTDRTRHVEDSVRKILDDLRWLGMNWDEGPEAGGESGPYYQSHRLDIYKTHLERILESGAAYYSMETREQLEAMRKAAKREKRNVTYVRPSPLPTVEEGRKARDVGHPVVVRLKMPNEDITVRDDILGEVTLAADQLEDFVIQKSDGFPTYHFACVVDDALMKVTHVLRGQEHLMNTPKHIAIQRALGFSTPRYAHLPVIFNMDGSKMSKRDKEKAIKKGLQPPEIDVHDFRAAGYLPEAVLNFLSLLGWSPGDDLEQFDLDRLTSMFTIERVGKTNARFDREKLLAFNTDWSARLPDARLLEAFKDYLSINPELPQSLRQADDALLSQVLDACRGFRTFADILTKAGFLFVDNEAIQYDPKAVKKVLAKNDNAGYDMLRALQPKLESIADWSAVSLEELVHTICEEKECKMGQVAQPIRVAVSGSTISPSIGVTLTLLGRDCTLARIKRCLSESM
ncbi:MAG: glutamate--tRNA ligase [Planctomycetes bacterium]|nr:glutamate--tRNA ligase [Planctomycetota bacterium]